MGVINSSQGELLPMSREIASKPTYTQFLVLHLRPRQYPQFLFGIKYRQVDITHPTIIY
jgi:hypothetical protein